MLSCGDLNRLRYYRVTASHVERQAAVFVFSISNISSSSSGDDVASSASQRANELTPALCVHLVTRVRPSPNTPFHIGVLQSIDPAPAAQLIPSLLLSIRRRRFAGPRHAWRQTPIAGAPSGCRSEAGHYAGVGTVVPTRAGHLAAASHRHHHGRYRYD